MGGKKNNQTSKKLKKNGGKKKWGKEKLGKKKPKKLKKSNQLPVRNPLHYICKKR